MNRTMTGLLAAAAAALTGCGGGSGEVNEALASNAAEAANLILDDPGNAEEAAGNAANSAEPVASNVTAPPPAAIAPVRVEREEGRAIAAPPPQRPPEPTTEPASPTEPACAPEHRAAGHC